MHMMITIVSLDSLVIWFPHWQNIVMIDQLDYCMLETVVHPNVYFIRDALKEVQDIGVGLFENYFLMGNFIISQPLSVVEVSYHTIQMASENFDQNIHLMEEYDRVTWPILTVTSPSSLDFLDRILSSDE